MKIIFPLIDVRSLFSQFNAIATDAHLAMTVLTGLTGRF